jgi:transposase
MVRPWPLVHLYSRSDGKRSYVAPWRNYESDDDLITCIGMGKNRYARRSKLSEAKFRDFLRCFALDMEATKIAQLTHLNRNTVNRLIKAVRERIAEACEHEARAAAGAAPEFHSGNSPRRILRRPGVPELAQRVAVGRVLPDGRIYTWIVPPPHDSEQSESQSDLTASGKVQSLEPFAALLPTPTAGADADSPNLSRSLDSFLGQAKLRLAKFKGISRQNYYLHLKESEYRFNHRKDDLYPLLLELVREHPLF